MFVFQQLGQRVRKSLGRFVVGGSVQRNVDLQSLGTGSFRKTLQSEVLEDLPQPEPYLAALQNICRRAWIEIEHHHGRASDVFRERKRWMQLNRRQIRQPNERGQIVSQNVVDGSAVSLAPDGSGLHPVGPVLRRVLLVEELLVHAVGVALAG